MERRNSASGWEGVTSRGAERSEKRDDRRAERFERVW